MSATLNTIARTLVNIAGIVLLKTFYPVRFLATLVGVQGVFQCAFSLMQIGLRKMIDPSTRDGVVVDWALSVGCVVMLLYPGLVRVAAKRRFQ